MSSDSEFSESSTSSVRDSSGEESENYEAFNGQYAPYEDEPLAEADEHLDDENNLNTEEADLDGLTPSILEARYERTVEVETWCKCEHCKIENLVGALEFRCCQEVVDAVGKMVFDGSIEKIKCITEHEDFEPLSNRTVLLQVGPLLKHRDGSRYHKKAGRSQNEFIRATAYRWIILWLCGYMGWENTRPLPACIYHNIRSRYQTGGASGYQGYGGLQTPFSAPFCLCHDQFGHLDLG